MTNKFKTWYLPRREYVVKQMQEEDPKVSWKKVGDRFEQFRPSSESSVPTEWWIPVYVTRQLFWNRTWAWKKPLIEKVQQPAKEGQQPAKKDNKLLRKDNSLRKKESNLKGRKLARLKLRTRLTRLLDARPRLLRNKNLIWTRGRNSHGLGPGGGNRKILLLARRMVEKCSLEVGLEE